MSLATKEFMKKVSAVSFVHGSVNLSSSRLPLCGLLKLDTKASRRLAARGKESHVCFSLGVCKGMNGLHVALNLVFLVILERNVKASARVLF